MIKKGNPIPYILIQRKKHLYEKRLPFPEE
jgi:hypothetical protein